MRSKSALLLIVFVVMNAALLVSNCMLTRTVKDMGQRNFVEVADLLSKERAKLSAERALLADKMSMLKEAVDAVRALSTPANAAEAAEKATKAATGTEKAGGDTAERDGKPDIDSIPLMSEEEKVKLMETAASMPKLRSGVLFQGDVDALVKDREWNPAGRQLRPEDREELGKLLRDYQYFAKASHFERYEKMVAPAIPRLREAGAYVEYGAGDPPPTAEGIKLTHAEKTRDGTFRMYFFSPENYPEMYRHRTVAEERAKETFVNVYQFMNTDK